MKKYWIPFLLSIAVALVLVVGIKIGEARMANAIHVYQSEHADLDNVSSGGLSSSEASAKLVYLFDLLRDRYVDTLNLQNLVEDAIPTIVEELDPHSTYISREDMSAVTEQLEGSFSGVGIQFNIQQDTVMVIQVISGGPSEKVGILPGDRIVTVDDSLFVGKEINNDLVLKTLRGEKGSVVKLGIRRNTAAELLDFEVVRGDIPVNSVVAQYMEGNIGYIKIDNFGRNTYNEFFTALINLRAHGAKGYLLDFRGNGGGYLEICIAMVNEFLGNNQLIVYTEGRAQPRSDHRADGHGNFQNDPVVVLIDEWSASASEIFAGALQDNDRAQIVGRRSFGKGLVQQQFDLYDGSALRLTIARYHTPSGRFIQKPYSLGEGEDYQMDLINRYEHGEFYNQDSIHFADSLIYKTASGRTVYGGGGIMPDVFVPSDTSYVSAYYNKCISLMYSFAFQYSDNHRETISTYKDFRSLQKHLEGQGLLHSFVTYATPKVGRPTAKELQRSGAEIERLIIAYIMRQCKDENYFYQEFNSSDKTYLKGLELFTTSNE
jgi:carboxyl-terminal processing protease